MPATEISLLVHTGVQFVTSLSKGKHQILLVFHFNIQYSSCAN